MTQNLVNFSNVDFDQIKESIKSYLRTNSNFTDYDFEGSNLSTIIDTLAFNTYINSYNANMVTNEVFLDSATLRENVVSLARNIGYVPTSRKASKAKVSFSVDMTGSKATSVTLKAGIVATSAKTLGNRIFTFVVPSDITRPVLSSGSVEFENIDIYEGNYITQTFSVSSSNPNQRYLLTNSGIDVSSIKVIVNNSQSSQVKREFFLYKSLYQVDGNTPAYFIKETEGERYELLFGDGIFGKKLVEPNFVTVSYITSNGATGNNVSAFSFAGQLRDDLNRPVTNNISLLSTVVTSNGGSSIESVDSVKKYAPQIYASQNRAVTATDYETIIPTIYAEAESVSAFGGEDLTPPRYGKVFISIKPTNGVFLSSAVKRNLQQELKRYTVAGILPEIIDLKYLYLETDSFVYYNTNLASSANSLSSTIQKNIEDYAKSSQLNKFGARFKYSKYQKVIDESNNAITSNITTVGMRRDLVPTLNQFVEYEICFGNRFYLKNKGVKGVSDGVIVGYNIKSSGFTVSGISGTVYLGDSPNADQKTGSVFLFKLNAPDDPVIVKNGVGTIDYEKGEIKLSPIKIINTTLGGGSVPPTIQISAIPYSNDVIELQDLYLQLDTSYVTVSMIADEISSGNDLSGTNYNVKSSYTNGNLVRGPVITVSNTSNT